MDGPTRMETETRRRSLAPWRGVIPLLLLTGCGGTGGTGPDGGDQNHPPVFGDLPTLLYHDRDYAQQVPVSDPDGDALTVEAVTLPDWLHLDPVALTLTGVPGGGNIGSQSFSLRAWDGTASVGKIFPLEVQLAPCLERASFGEPEDSPYVLPVPPGDTVFVLQSYCGPGSHSRDNQLAYDFRTAFGAPIVAARGGEVKEAVGNWADSDKVDSHFNLLVIQHTDGTFAFYAHLKQASLRVQVGDQVTQGQLIAESGESGTPTFCDFGACGVLHFGVYQGSWTVDLPVNFRNAQGTLDERGGLVLEATYLALPQGGTSTAPPRYYTAGRHLR